MVCALKRIAVEVHNVAVHDRGLMRISSVWTRSDPAQHDEGEGVTTQPGRLEGL